MSQTHGWAKIITDNSGLIDKDVRIFFEQNCLKVEKWVKNKCKHRMLVTHYSQIHDPAERDITNVKKIKNQALNYNEEYFKLIIL